MKTRLHGLVLCELLRTSTVKAQTQERLDARQFSQGQFMQRCSGGRYRQRAVIAPSTHELTLLDATDIAQGREIEQPADLVLLCAFSLYNVHLMLLSGIGTRTVQELERHHWR
jgi:hypothetical protein